MSAFYDIKVKFREGGEVCRLNGRFGAYKLKKLFQEWGVPPWERNRIPLLVSGNNLLMIVGYAICAAEGNEDGLEVFIDEA